MDEQEKQKTYQGALRAGRLVYQATLILKQELGFTSEMCLDWMKAIVEETPYKPQEKGKP